MIRIPAIRVALVVAAICHVAGHAVGADRASGGGGADVPRAAVRDVHAAERPAGDPEPGSPAAAGGREPLVPRRSRQRRARPHRLRAPVRAPDVPGLEAHAARFAFPDARGGRRHRHQRHHRLRPHQLLRDGAVEPARAGAVDRIRSHGLPPRHRRSGGACRTSRTWSATSGARASRTSRTGSSEEAVVHLLYPKGHPYYGSA